MNAGSSQQSAPHYNSGIPSNARLSLFPASYHNTSTAVRRPRSRSGNCKICGYDHNNPGSNHGSANNKKPDGCKDDKGGSGDRNDDRKKDSGKGQDNSGNDSDPDPDSDDDMNGNDPRVCPDECASFLFWAVGVLILLFLLGTFFCAGYESFQSCISGTGGGPSSCLNDNLRTALKKSGIGRGGKDSFGVPAHLQEEHRRFQKAIKNSDCYKTYSRNTCEGLANYASDMAGAEIVSTGQTKVYPSPMLCRCADKKIAKQLCTPNQGPCTNCRCGKIEVQTVITEETSLVPGICWAFSGVGEIQMRMFFPIIVLGVTIHHPAKGRLPPGYFASAPKDFELWGLANATDKNPHSFGQFQFKENDGPTQIFEVQRHSSAEYQHVKFNFTSNHGNPNYTALYKIEVHGLLDHN